MAERPGLTALPLLGLAALLAAALAPGGAASEKLTDPSQPPGLQFVAPVEMEAITGGGTRENWRLRFVRLSELGGVAVINNRILGPGDEVEGFTLLEVRPDGVWGMAFNQKVWLRIPADREKSGMTVRQRDD